MITKISKRTFYPLILLLIPLIGIFFSEQVNWSLFDFIIMGGLLFSVGLAIDLVLSNFSKLQTRLIYISLIIIALLLIWAELAIGLFGSPFAGN